MVATPTEIDVNSRGMARIARYMVVTGAVTATAAIAPPATIAATCVG